MSGSDSSRWYSNLGSLRSSVATHDLADQTSALLYPVVVGHLNSHTGACLLQLHNYVDLAAWRREHGTEALAVLQLRGCVSAQPRTTMCALSQGGR